MMKLSTFDLNHVRALHFLLEEAHVARAARRLGITAAAASNALRRLREEFDDPLLVRAGRGLCRTPLADELRGPARDVLAAAERLLGAGGRFDARTYQGPFEVSASDRVAMGLVSALDELLRERGPQATLRLRPAPLDVVGWLRDGGGVAIGPFEARDGQLRVEPLFVDRYVCVLRRGHPLLRGPWSARRFAAAEHVLVTPQLASDRGDVDVALADRGLSRRVTRVVPLFALVAPLLLASDRVATLPRSYLRIQPLPAGLAVRPPPLPLAPLAMTLAWHPRFEDAPEHAFLRALVRDAARLARLGDDEE